MNIKKSLIVVFFIVTFFLTILSSCSGSSIPPAKIESFSEVKTIKVLVEQSYYDDKGNNIEGFLLPVYEDCKVILENIGFSVTGENSKNYSSILEIKINGTALCDYYYDSDTKTKILLYTGTKLDGSILFKVENVDSQEKNFFEIREPPIGTISKPLTPSNAPFDRLGWQKHLFLILSDIWGPEILSKSLEVKGIFMRGQVIEALAEVKDPLSVNILINILEDENFKYHSKDVMEVLGKKGDESAVPVLIDILINDEYYMDREAAAEALGKIGDGRALDALNQALKEDEDEDVRKACMKAINKIME